MSSVKLIFSITADYVVVQDYSAAEKCFDLTSSLCTATNDAG